MNQSNLSKPIKFNFIGSACQIKAIRSEYNERKNRSRVYIWIDDEGTVENLVNRVNRPVALWKKIALAGLREFGLTIESIGGLQWSQYAGCSCACSPGFIVKQNLTGYDFHINVKSKSNEVVTSDKAITKRAVVV